jgi:hypothetical protein
MALMSYEHLTHATSTPATKRHGKSYLTHILRANTEPVMRQAMSDLRSYLAFLTTL